MYRNPINAYKAEEKRHLSGRETEARVLTECAMKLKKIQQNWDATDRDKQLFDALRYNQRIWSIFQSELARPDNPLPKKLKEDLLNLSIFVDRRIFDVMAFPESAKLDILIKINQNIAAGLRSTPAPQEAAQEVSPQKTPTPPPAPTEGHKMRSLTGMAMPKAYATTGAAI